MPCLRCGVVQTDPVRGAPPWVRGVAGGEQVLVCPDCQAEDPGVLDRLDRCARCGSTRMSMVMGSRVCRKCGYDAPVTRR